MAANTWMEDWAVFPNRDGGQIEQPLRVVTRGTVCAVGCGGGGDSGAGGNRIDRGIESLTGISKETEGRVSGEVLSHG